MIEILKALHIAAIAGWPGSMIDWPAAIAETALGVAPDEARSFASRIRDGA